MTQRIALRKAIELINSEDNAEIVSALEKLANQLDHHAKKAKETYQTKQEEKRG